MRNQKFTQFLSLDDELIITTQISKLDACSVLINFGRHCTQIFKFYFNLSLAIHHS